MHASKKVFCKPNRASHAAKVTRPILKSSTLMDDSWSPENASMSLFSLENDAKMFERNAKWLKVLCGPRSSTSNRLVVKRKSRKFKKKQKRITRVAINKLDIFEKYAKQFIALNTIKLLIYSR